MSLDEFLYCVRLAKVKWRVSRSGMIKPCPVLWMCKNTGILVKGSTYVRAKRLGFSDNGAWMLADAIENESTPHMILRMELEDLCRTNC